MEATEIKFIGYSAFEITTSKGIKILLDPFLEQNPTSVVKVKDLKKVDLVLVTHGAIDHLGEADVIAKKFNVPVACGADVASYLLDRGVPRELVKGLVWGLTVNISGVQIRGLECRHHSVVTLKNGNIVSSTPFSFIIDADPGVRIYASGDTSLFSDMKLIGELHRPNIGLLNVTHAWTWAEKYMRRPDIISGFMTPYEAALAAHWLGLEYVIPHHFDDPEPAKTGDVKRFADLVENMSLRGKGLVKPVVLKPGEVFRYELKKTS